MPENTVAAVRYTAERLPAVEIDVRRCGSGELVCMHDETVDRVTDGSGAVASLTLNELRELRVEESEERPPTLDEVIAACPSETKIYVELKEADSALDAIATIGNRPKTTIISFKERALREVPDPELPLGYLFREHPVTNLETAISIGCQNVHPHWQICVSTDVVDMAHEAGLSVITWGVYTDRSAIQGVRDAGVDGITIDHPDIS